MDARPATPRRAVVAARVRRLADRTVVATATRAATVVMAGALVATGTTVHAQWVTAREDAALSVALAQARQATAAEVARWDRVVAADVDRLTGAAVRYAALRRAEALAAARAAVVTADAVVVTGSASPDVPAEALAPLGEAAASLVALIDATPAPTAATPVSTPASTAMSTGAPTDVPMEPAAGGTGTDPAPVGPTVVPTTVPTTVPVAPTTVPVVPTTVPTTVPVVPTTVPTTVPVVPTTVPVTVPVPVDSVATAGTGVTTGTGVTSATVPVSSGATPATAPPAPPADVLRALDLTVSAEVLAAAHRVTDLSAEAQAAADAAVAAAQALREAARLAEEAARAEAAALAERIAATDAAPNGRIPTELLCPVEIAPDALLRCDAARALDELAAAYRADVGRDLVVVSTYRSFEAQVAVKAAKGGLAAPPGRSNHGRALAVDFGGFGGVGDFSAPAYGWMTERAHEFGWHHPTAMEPGGSGPQEPWHWEFDTEDPGVRSAGAPRPVGTSPSESTPYGSDVGTR